ncbi:hypothetical protein AAHA92_22423 [Salvia divinorum]|uniref:Uncharacterized protein n=1 Tax=Salvia divinorum TaxID=28513 RepID=A0ABD1GNM8_SALDI
MGDGEFHVRRYNYLTGCPPRVDYKGALYGEPESEGEPNVYSSDDYTTSDEGMDDDSDSEYIVNRHNGSIGEHPSFTIILTNSHIQRTLVMIIISFFFHRHFARVNALKVGMCCHFYLVDANAVQFYVVIDR